MCIMRNTAETGPIKKIHDALQKPSAVANARDRKQRLVLSDIEIHGNMFIILYKKAWPLL